ncbi:methyltransferase domain-containing protein [Streptomyces sp. NPDC051243]|uniref:class I SAM-dependent methyltransferase n=1 Tax=Streptomyces sp. NPDC051243 TaxID=3365646 RepID=UPI00379DBC2A
MAGSRYPHHVHPGSGAPPEPDDLYAEPPPWGIGRPQPAFLALAEAGVIRARCWTSAAGPASTYSCVPGSAWTPRASTSPPGPCAAEEKARERGRTARFLHGDARKLSELRETFGTVLDCGLFHIVDADDRAAYVDNLRAAIRPGGRYFMLGLSDRQPGDWGCVHKLTRAEIEASLTNGWRIDSIDPSTIDITTDPDGIRAWLVALTRI